MTLRGWGWEVEFIRDIRGGDDVGAELVRGFDHRQEVANATEKHEFGVVSLSKLL